MPLELRDGIVQLRLVSPTDINILQRIMPDDFEHDPGFDYQAGETENQHRQRWFSHWLHDLLSHLDSSYPFIVLLEGSPVGFQLLEIEKDDDGRLIADTSSFVIPQARGKRLGVSMRRAILTFAFDTLQVDRAISSANVENIASHKVSERSGYRMLGDFTSEYSGIVQTLRRFEITREEWLQAGKD